jgi:hypothetical protein
MASRPPGPGCAGPWFGPGAGSPPPGRVPAAWGLSRTGVVRAAAAGCAPSVSAHDRCVPGSLPRGWPELQAMVDPPFSLFGAGWSRWTPRPASTSSTDERQPEPSGWSASARSCCASTSGRVVPAARPLLLVNGIGAAFESFDPLVDALEPDRPVIRFDPRVPVVHSFRRCPTACPAWPAPCSTFSATNESTSWVCRGAAAWRNSSRGPPDDPAVAAPEQAAIPALELFGMRRVPGDPGPVELPGEVRYRIGCAHRRCRALCICIACGEPSGCSALRWPVRDSAGDP